MGTRALLGVAMLAFSGRASAAEIRLRAPSECVKPEDLSGRVAHLLGSAVGAAENIVFDVEVERENGAWHVRVESAPREGERRTRQISGKTCEEVVDAAAVAITLALRASERDAHQEVAEAEATSSEEEPLSPVLPARRERAQDESTPLGARESGRARVGMGLAAVIESGALPNPAPGVELQAALGFRSVRVMALGSAFFEQRAELANGHGGVFQLWQAALLACLERRFSLGVGIGCGGWEFGRLSGEGSGITNPESGSQLWSAPRAEIGALFPLGDGFHLVVRAGAAVPLVKSSFFLGGSERVHRPGQLSGRVLLGVELAL